MQSYENLAANLAAIQQLGDVIAASQMFGSLTKAQGQVIAAHCFITGIPLLDYQRRNMLVGNRPGIPYDAMGAAFQEAGGEIRVVEKSASAARLVLVYKGKETPFELTWEQVRQEPFCYASKEAEALIHIRNNNETWLSSNLKAKYATPRSRAVMLWARCVSDAIRTVCPQANFGTYTPEELSDIEPAAPQVATATNQGAAGPAATNPVTPKPAAPPVSPPVASPQPAAPIADAAPPVEAKPAPEPATAAPTEPLPPGSPPAGDDTKTSIDMDGPATMEQRQKALGYLAELQSADPSIPAKLKAKLDACGIKDGILGLTFSEADKLIQSLQVKQIDQFFTLDLQGRRPKA